MGHVLAEKVIRPEPLVRFRCPTEGERLPRPEVLTAHSRAAQTHTHTPIHTRTQ